jgi:DNA-binding NtrC family response regulator
MNDHESAATFKKRIVILEPYDNLRESLQLILGNDYSLFFSGTFEEALKEIRQHRAGLFILDVNNEDVGLKRIEEAKHRFPDLPILITSINPNWPFKEKAVRIGKAGIRFQDKPFGAKEFREHVDLVINGDSDRHQYILRVPAAPPR